MATNVKHKDSNKYNKALTLDDRIAIDSFISKNRDGSGKMTITLNEMAAKLEKDPTTISKELKNHRSTIVFKKVEYIFTKSFCKVCAKNKTCTKSNNIQSLKGECADFENYLCPHLKKFPWVCNGCSKRGLCTCAKSYYSPSEAEQDYKDLLVSSRTGVLMKHEEFRLLDDTISAGLRKGQSIVHIINGNNLKISVTSAYNYLRAGYFSANIANTHRMASRVPVKPNKRAYNSLVLKELKQGRNYDDFIALLSSNPSMTYAEMDTVEGTKGGKVVLSLKVVNVQMQFYFILADKSAASVVAKLNELEQILGIENYMRIFGYILTDNGTEFTDIPGMITSPTTGVIRSNIYFCHPHRSDEKGSCENNHELFRYILPKGKSFDKYDQKAFTKVTNHVNSLIRESVAYSTPIEKFKAIYGNEILEKLEVSLIPPNEVLLKPELLD